MRDGVRWATVIALNTLAFAGVFILFYAVRVPLMPSAEEGRIAVGVAAATVVATIGGTAGAAWVSRATARTQPPPVPAGPGPDPARDEPARVLVRMGELPLEPRGFQLRTDLLATLEQAAGEPGLTVVHAVTGARGVGKTQLAAAYARRRAVEGWPVVAWLTAENGGRLAAGLAELADRLGVRAPGDDVEAAARAALGWFGAHPDLPCLIVVDNATDPDEVAAWLPTAGRAQVVVTTTVRSFGNIAGAQVDVDVFTRQEALDFLGKRSGCGQDDGAAELAAELGCLPLALAQAAEVIRGRGGGYRAYLERLRAYPVHEVLARVPGDRYPHRAAEAVLLAVEEVEGRPGGGGRLVRLLLDVLSVLSPDGVSHALLHGVVELAGTHDAPAAEDALGALVEASLITRVGDDAVGVHRLVQRVLRERARREGTLDAAVDPVVRHLDVLLVPAEDAWRLRERGRRLAVQVEALWDALRPELAERGVRAMEPLLELRSWAANDHLAEVGDLTRALAVAGEIVEACDAAADVPDEMLRDALWSLGQICVQAGRMDDALAVRRRRLALVERAPDVVEERVYFARAELAATYQLAGRFDASVSLYEDTVRDAERMFGTEHADTLTARGRLVRAYAAAGRLSEAVALSERMRAGLTDGVRTGPGPGAEPDGASELSSWRTLAGTYESAGLAGEGAALLRQFLAERVREVGEDAPEVVLARNDLALNCLSAGRYDEALTVARRAAADAVRVFGDGSEETADVRDTLALCLMRLDRDEESIELHRKVVADLTALHGPDHRGTLSARVNLARALGKGLRESAADATFRDVLADYTRTLGPEHPDTLNARSQYIRTCFDAGRTAEAITVAREVLADTERVYGTAHPRALGLRLDLATLLQEEGRIDEAATRLRHALRDITAALGARHPQALRARADLASALNALGGADEACALREENVAQLARLYGDDHIDTVWARGATAVAYGWCGRYEEAVALRVAVLHDLVRLRGVDHRDTLMARRRLARAYGAAGHHHKRVELFEESLAENTRVFGEHHPATLAVRMEYAMALTWTGRWRQVRKLTGELYTDYRGLLGPRHPYTVGALRRSAYPLRRCQRRIKVLGIRKQVLAETERRSGPLGDDTVVARRRLGSAYVSVGLVWRNVAVQRRLLTDLTEEFGPDHPWTLAQRDWWAASALRYSGRWRRALTAMRELAADYARLYGADHPWTLDARAGAAHLARRTGRVRAAVTEFAALAADRERLHGPDHVWAVQARAHHAYALLWALRPHRSVAHFDRLLRDTEGIFGPHAHQLRSIGRRYLLLCLATGHWHRAREALRILRRV